MKLEKRAGGATLGQIEKAFKAYKPKSGKSIHFPKDLRMLAVSALDSGLTAAKIARAAGVTPKSIRNWRNASYRKRSIAPAPEIKRLKIVSQRVSRAREALSGDMISTARISLGSGVVIEVSSSELSTDFLKRLCGLGLQ